MNNDLFRKKNMDRVSSPEQLNDRIRVTGFGVWLLLSGILLVLAGIVVWGIFGRLDTSLPVSAITQQGQTVCYVKEQSISQIQVGMAVDAESGSTTVASIAVVPVQVDDQFPEYLCHVGALSRGEWVYEVTLQDALGEDGSIFAAQIVTESIAPLTFVVN
jgi:hypothetical protein